MFDRPRTATVASLLAAVLVTAHTASAAEPEWIRQFRSEPSDAGTDSARAVATGPNGTVHVVGWAAGSLGGPNKGDDDAFIITLDGDGNVVWKRQPGTAMHTGADAVTTDAAGNVYLAGSFDAFLIKFDPDGRILWRRQPPPTSPQGFARSVATDRDGNVYVVGNTLDAFAGSNKGGGDAFVIKFSADGRRLWSRQPGTPKSDYAGGVATDRDGNVYVTGATEGALGGTYKGMTDAFVIKYDPDGRILWKRQPGTPRGDGSGGIATDADGNVFIAGGTTGRLSGPNAGALDAFLIKLDGNGRYLWERQIGTPQSEAATGVATDADGNVVIAGRTQDALAGPYAGNGDAFLIKFDGAGTELWRDQRGTADSEFVNGVATDRDGNVYVTGSTAGNLDGVDRPPSVDAFVIKYGPDGPQ